VRYGVLDRDFDVEEDGDLIETQPPPDLVGDEA
jgi:hypothetical protein